MAVEKATGIVIRLTDYSETSQIAVFQTDTLGKISALAKGSKRSDSPTGGPLDLLTLNDIVVSMPKQAGKLATLREARTLVQFPRIRGNLSRYYAGLYCGELAGIFGEGSEGASAHFDALVEALSAVNDAPERSILNVVLCFEGKVLEVSGLALNLDGCAQCGRELPAKDFRISLEDGGGLCGQCPGGKRMPPGSLAALRRILASNCTGVQRLRLTGDISRDVSGLLSAAVVLNAGRIPRLLAYAKPEKAAPWRRWLVAVGKLNQLERG